MVRAIYPGTFDPVHNGHVDITTRAAKVFDQLLVAVYESPPNGSLFSTQERVELFAQSVRHLPNVEVGSFSGLVPVHARRVGARLIVRGLRAGFDFEAEFEMALMWRKLDEGIDVVCLMSALEYQFVHASRIKEVAQLGGDVEGLVPDPVNAMLKARFDSVS